MTLTLALQTCHSEEDVKDAYIKALGLTALSKGLIDIRTDEIWFEAKESPTPPALMFAQLLFYVRDAHKKGEDIPLFLAVIDREKAALMPTKHALILLSDDSIKWPKSASQVTKTIASQIAPYIEAHFVVYTIATDEIEFIAAVKTAIKSGAFVRTFITPDNLKQVFDKWVDMVAREVIGLSEVNYALVFFADIMHDGNRKVMTDLSASLAYEDGKPLFMLHDKPMRLSSSEGYRRFWAMYHRPPEAEHREYLLARRDSLLPLDERNFKGAYYTPLKVVDKAYDLLAQTLGKNWQQKYIVWDMCCGVGNLEVKHSNHNNLFMSTLDQADIDVMKAAKTCVQATKFQYDYLNDDIDDFGNIDYQISHKLPVSLRQAIADANKGVKGAKQILVLINPPYAEAGTDVSTTDKAGVAKTRFATSMEAYGKASNELFTQFIARIHQEIPNAKLAMFSTLKYVNAPNFEQFRQQWQAKYLNGFVVHSKTFDTLKGNFPIGFLIWDTSKKKTITEITATVLDKNANMIGKKTFHNLPNKTLLNVWLKRPKSNRIEVIPLKNTISPAGKSKSSLNIWSNNAIGYMRSSANDIQHANQHTALFSSTYSDGHGFYINKDNLAQAAIVFTVRRLIKPTWLNDRDQFLQPTEPLTEVFKNDCLVWMLFNGSNLTASANNLEWNEKKWSIVNHFIPFTAAEVGANDKFESSFMVDYLNTIKKMQLSKEAKTVLAQGKTLWQQYHATEFERKIKDEFKLNRADVGWYQIRKALEAHAKNEVVDFDPFKTTYTELSEKLRPMVYELGFLK